MSTASTFQILNPAAMQQYVKKYGAKSIVQKDGKAYIAAGAYKPIEGTYRDTNPRVMAANNPVVPPPVAPPPVDQNQSLIDQIIKSLYPATTPPPSFENSGLYNEADVTAQANADYQPTFQTEQQRLAKQQEISTKGLGQQQQQQTGNQLSDYYNRGLSKSGAFQGAQQYLGQNQAYDTSNLLANQGYDTSALGQQQKSTLAGVKANAYKSAFDRYLNQFNTK